jgi:O-antigen ligase
MRRAGTRPRWPVVVAVVYAWLIPFQPVIPIGGGSQLRLAAADLVAPLVVLAALAAPRRRLPPLAALLAALPVLALFATLLAASQRDLSGYAIGKTAGLFYLVALALALARALPADGAVAVLRGLGAAAFWSAAIGLAGYVAWLHGTATTLVDGGRLCSTMTGDPNIYCSLLAVGIVVVATDAGRAPLSRAGRVLVLGLALLATGSRSGTVGLAVGVGVAVLLAGRDRWVAAARGAYAGVVAAVAVGAVAVTGVGGEIGAALFGHLWRTRTVESRFDLYRQAWAEFSAHPVLGLGIGGFRDLNTWTSEGLKFHSAVHNTYLWGMVDLGVGGGLLVLGTVVGALGYALRASRSPDTAAVARPVAAGLATMAVFNLFVDGFYQRHFWLLVACALMLPGMARAARRARHAAEPVPWAA